MYGDKGTAQHKRRIGASDKEARRLDDPHHPFLDKRTTPRRQDGGTEGLNQSHTLHYH